MQDDKLKFTCGMWFVLSKNLILSFNNFDWLLRYLAISLNEKVLVDEMDIWNWLPLALREVNIGGSLVMEEIADGRFSLEVDALDVIGDPLVVKIIDTRG